MRFRTLCTAVALMSAAIVPQVNAASFQQAPGTVRYTTGGDLAARKAIDKVAPFERPARTRVLKAERSAVQTAPDRYVVIDLVVTPATITATGAYVDLATGTKTTVHEESAARRGHVRTICTADQDVPNPARERCEDVYLAALTAVTVACTSPTPACFLAIAAAAAARVVCDRIPPTVHVAGECEQVQQPHTGQPRVDQEVDEQYEYADENFCKGPCEIELSR